MLNGLDTMSQLFLADLGRIQDRQQRAQAAIGSGYRVNSASDAPERVIDILQLRSEVSRAESVGVTLDRATAEVNTAEAAVRVMVDIVERARVLGAQAATSTAENRQAISVEVRQLHEQLVNLSLTVSEGRYVFSGDLDTQPIYKQEWSSPKGIAMNPDAGTGPANTRKLVDVNGSTFSIARTAQELLDSSEPGENVFEGLYSLAKALEDPAVDPEVQRAGAQAAVDNLAKALQKLGRDVTFYGHAQNRVKDATTLNMNALVARKQELGQQQDVDLAEALVELTLARVHHEAALGAQAKMPRTSLFDFLG